MSNLPTRQPPAPIIVVRQPTLGALALVVAGLFLLFITCVAAMAVHPSLGYRRVSFPFVVLALWLLLRQARPGPAPVGPPPVGRLLLLRRLLRGARWLFTGLLAVWFGLLLWWEVSPGGPLPEPKKKAEAALIRVVTWNIHVGRDEGWPWEQWDWSRRKHALGAAVEKAQPDILCVQEALPEQLRFLDQTLPGHARIGDGRDGGRAGEHCAIFYGDRFDKLDGGTFWLEEPTDQPRPGSALGVKRICTWVRLRDRQGKRTFRVYNTHLYLTEDARRAAVQVILDHIAAGDPSDAVVLTADFNASPGAPSRRLFSEAGLLESAPLAKQPADAPTMQIYGIPLWSFDGILVSPGWQVRSQRVLDVKPGNTFPSDHFGVLADLALAP